MVKKINNISSNTRAIKNPYGWSACAFPHP